MSNMSDNLDKLAEAIRNLNPYANPTVQITTPKVGLIYMFIFLYYSECKLFL